MRYYCTLIVRSNSEDIASSVFHSNLIDMLGFEDTRSESNLARATRWRNNNLSTQFVMQNDLPRFCWSLTSLKGVDANEPEVHVHLSWLFLQLKSATSLASARKKGAQVALSFYWGGQGTGGGPTITPSVAALLCQHEINLNVGFYFEGIQNG